MNRSRTKANRRPAGATGPRVGRRWQIVGVAAVAVTIVGVGLGVASASTNQSSGSSTIVCPAVAPALPAIPAASQAEVERNLALLNTQIAEANNRLRTSVGQGGPNFVQNAILGPLKDKRASTIDRIALSIGRHASRPNLDTNALGTCAVSNGGAAAAEPTQVAAAAGNNNGGNKGGGNGKGNNGNKGNN